VRQSLLFSLLVRNSEFNLFIVPEVTKFFVRELESKIKTILWIWRQNQRIPQYKQMIEEEDLPDDIKKLLLVFEEKVEKKLEDSLFKLQELYEWIIKMKKEVEVNEER
jgi:hypothetical protein